MQSEVNNQIVLVNARFCTGDGKRNVAILYNVRYLRESSFRLDEKVLCLQDIEL